jgi:Bacterial Ig-like domain (group 2)
MPNLWLDEDLEATDDLDGESVEDTGNGDPGSVGEEEYDDAEASAAAMRRRREQRRRALARRELLRRRELARRRAAMATVRERSVAARGPVTTRAAVRRTQAAVRSLDLDGKVQADAFKRALAAEAARANRAQFATVAGAVVNLFQTTFEDRIDVLKNPVAKGAGAFVPLLLLPGKPPGGGAAAYARDPRVVGGAAIAAILVAHKLTEPRRTLVSKVDVVGKADITQGAKLVFIADVIDDKGRVVPNTTVTWTSTNPTAATVDPNTGEVTAVGPGFAVITAAMDGIVGRTPVTVSPGGEAAVPAGPGGQAGGAKAAARQGQGGS